MYIYLSVICFTNLSQSLIHLFMFLWMEVLLTDDLIFIFSYGLYFLCFSFKIHPYTEVRYSLMFSFQIWKFAYLFGLPRIYFCADCLILILIFCKWVSYHPSTIYWIVHIPHLIYMATLPVSCVHCALFCFCVFNFVCL